MASVRWLLYVCLAFSGLAAACAAPAGAPTAETPVTGETPPVDQTPPTGETPTDQEGVMAFTLESSAFAPDDTIPQQYTCDGPDFSPPLAWSDVPEGTQAFALIMDDPDAPVGVFTHWVLYNLSGDARDLREDVPKIESPPTVDALQGRNDFGRTGYGGPCPPAGPPHRYNFTLYALDSALDLGPGATKQQVLDAIEGHVLGEARLIGAYGR